MESAFEKWLLNLFLLFCFSLNILAAQAECPHEEKNPSDTSLVLPEEESERLVTLKGKLILRILHENLDQGPPGECSNPIYCWIVKMDPASFEIACNTPVRAAFHTPTSIRASWNHDELELTGNLPTKEWLYNHIDQTVTVEGYLWHAHTSHHHTPILMDSEPWF